MTKDEAERIAEQITRTIPKTIASVVALERNPMNSQWEIKVDEPKSADGGRGIYLWIRSITDWLCLQRHWQARKEKQTGA